MKSSRNIRNYFRITANRRRTLPILSVGVVTLVVISGVAAAQSPSAAPTDDKAIRPFHFTASKEALADMRKRIAATRWPDKETVDDQSQGVQLATMQALAKYWATDYDWSKCEAKLKALPQFITTIDGLDIHFIHVRSKEKNALPMIITHGWPGSIIEQMKIIGPLTDPTAYGGKAEDAFDVVIPSLPGYGFSGKPTTTGWDPQHIARAWTVLMKRLGYTKFVAQGGDWGAIVTELMGAQAPPELLGIHTNMPNVIPVDIDKLAFSGAPAPGNLSADEKLAYERLSFVYAKGIGYGFQLGLRPQTMYGIADSPVGLAAYFLDHDARSYEMIARVFDGKSEGLTRDDVLDNITLTWLTNTALSGARLYRIENGSRVLRFTNFKTSNGPDVHIYMVAAEDAGDSASVQHAAFVDLGLIKGNIGDQNYILGSDLDLAKYRTVSVWCKRFSRNFGAAPLMPAAQSTR